MLKKKVIRMKRKLDRLVVKKGISSPQLLRYSQKVDRLIVELMLLKAENPHHNMATAREHYFMDRSDKEKGTSGLHRGSILVSGFNIFSC